MHSIKIYSRTVATSPSMSLLVIQWGFEAAAGAAANNV